MQVKDIMTYGVVTVAPTATIMQACQKMKKENGSYLVVAHENTFRGIVTQKDIVERAILEGYDPLTTSIEEIMTDYVISCYASDDLSDTAKVMEKNEIGHIIVLDSRNHPIATLSKDDFLVWAIADDTFDKPLESPVRQVV